MTKQEFIDHYEIKDALPVDPSKKLIPAEAFYSAVRMFIDERFRGAAVASYANISSQSVLICADYAAYFLKMLLFYVYGREMLTISAESNDEALSIIISAENYLPLTQSEMNSLIRLARNAGMEIYPDKKSIRLTVAFSPAQVRRVYAVSVSDGEKLMVKKLVEIFYCGEPISLDATTCLLTERKRRSKENKK